MKKLIVVLIVCCFPITGVCAEDITSIKLASEAWEDFTNADGTGVYWDLFRAVYEPAGIKVEFEIVPYIRATKMVQNKQVDAVVGVYEDEFEPALFPKWHFDYDVVAAVFKKGKVDQWAKEESLDGKIGWIRGYEYDQYLTKEVDFIEVDSRKSAFKMLEVGHLDFFLDAEVDIESELEKEIINADEFQTETIFNLNLYLAFADNERGKGLKEIFDSRIEELVTSGELKPIFEKWESEYPFDE